MPQKYYDGTKLLTLKDINKKDPEIYICTSNRSAGKTTFFSSFLVRRFLRRGEKFAILYRYNYELDDVAEKFFKDIGALFFSGYSMESKRMASGIYHELFLSYPDSTEEKPHIESCGYAITLNSADQLKKYSHLFSDITWCMMDEFQSETNHYCSNEIRKFQSVHTTISRGQGKQARRVPVILISNPVSIINPYYVALGISRRLMRNTHYLRGNGWVLEQGYNSSASAALKESGFMSAFENQSYSDYATEGKYLQDCDSFISKLPETGKYLCTLKYQGSSYSVKEYQDRGFLYVSDSIDQTYPFRIAIDLEDHGLNYILLSRNDGFISRLRLLFEHGNVRFKNQLCKDAFMTLCSYKYMS